MKTVLLIIVLAVGVVQTLHAQQPAYTIKKFVSKMDTSEFKDIVPVRNGSSRTYLSINPEIFDIDDARSTYIFGVVRALVCVEGPFKNGTKNGLFTFYVIDSLDHSKRYKIWEQDITNDKINGQWKTFTLDGNLVNYRTYKDGILNGIAKNFWITGAVTEEREYFNGPKRYILRKYSTSGKIESETSFINEIPNGGAKKFYETGVLMDEVNLKNGELDGPRKYFYPSGALWIEYVYKDGRPWDIVANYDRNGNKRDPGTLKNGNGTIILYNDNDTPRETLRYQNGIELK